MQIHQMQVVFDAAEDRLRMRLSTTSGEEFRVFLTRRFVRLLWPELQRTVDRAAAARHPGPAARREIVSFEREKALTETDFKTPFQESGQAAPRQFPLGEVPFLATRAQVRIERPGTYRLTLDPQSGRGIELGLDDRLMHSLARLIESAARAAQWDLPFLAPASPAPAPGGAPAEEPPRLLN
ncbi:MAG: hypothetical protein JNM90_21440 [Burkholderiales bacterium]|nr:hypothetical protein [Burkholderiales bacterium]